MVQARLNPKLVRSNSEQSFELPDEVKRRHVYFASDVFIERVLPHFSQQLSSPAEVAEGLVSSSMANLQFSDAGMATGRPPHVSRKYGFRHT